MRKLIAVVGAVLSLAALPASAGFAGSSLRLDYFFPDLATSLDNTTQLVPFTGLTYVSFGPEFTPAGSIIFISVDNDTIVVTGQRSQIFSPGTFNGLSFFDVFASIDDIAGLTLIESTLPGLDASDLSFGADRVLINFADATGFNLETWRVEIQVAFVQVPEPNGLALAGLALLALAVSRRRWSQRNRASR